ncbi:YeaH/YhbH family protein [Halapricum hydrolyticum]|uniref:YeaH/YhbH family protein n=1 Tax=Halapricum hydrolyticum TaxID=2979991 RepID=A0AAE3I8F7_9EURY|nr:YeaH/YhbH family protein [Halapricum hydrolyticum]MCU4716824.1 YeaH/YhbH family protein [Halapricum hydrolyticum]MCU4725571.1 YeaH/YhbH family protein [Halapricum hydrolyticum]
MGLRDDLERYREVGEQRRQDLAEFIQYGDLGNSRADTVRIPIKIVDLPEFAYDRRDQGGVGQGEGAEEGDPVGQPQDDDDGEGEPGEDGGEHEYYEMDPEEFAQELDERLGLDLEPKGKKVIEETEGDFTDITRTGPSSTLDFERLFKEGLKRKMAMDFDEEYVREALRVDGWGPAAVYEWAREANIPVSRAWIEDAYEDLPADERDRWDSVEEMEATVDHETTAQRIRREGLEEIPFRSEDERYRYPEIVETRERNVVVVNIRDVSGSMRQKKRELVERTFTPLDWYLQGKYDNAEFVYIAHDAEAWEVDREEFFGIRSGGGTRISSAYELAAAVLDEQYPWSEWNRYVFAAGDSENSSNDTEQRVIPLMEEIPANLHAYVETQPSGNAINATHAEEVERHFRTVDDVAVAYVSSPEDVVDAIYEVLSTEEES